MAAVLFLIPGFPLFSAIIDLARFDFDAGTITTQTDDLEGAHDALSDKVQELVAAGSLPIILGGDGCLREHL